MTPAAPDEMPQEGGRSAEIRFHRLYGILRNRICLLDYPPGARLGEEALAAEFGVSRTPIRRVLGRLEADGLLRSVQGVGTIVTDIDAAALEQVYRLRMELAGLVGRLSPVPPGPLDVENLAGLADSARRLAATPVARTFAELNMAYFQALMRLTACGPLREVSEKLYYQTTRIWLKSIPQLDLGAEIATFRREVDDVLAAVQLGNLDAVGHIHRSHISMSFARLARQTGGTGAAG